MADPDTAAEQPVDRFTDRAMVFLIAAGAVILLLVGATAGLALSGRLSSSEPATTPASDSVDAGFARDMILHHDQAVLIAHYAEQHTTDPEIEVMAYEIGYTLTDQLGQMQGWLSLWDLPEFSSQPTMAWMSGQGAAHDGMIMESATATSAASSGTPLMPGMATDAEIDKLKGLTGAESDVYFLQLMIRNREGGPGMMLYAAEHAALPVVRNFADKMLQSQTDDSVMIQMLYERGAEPLRSSTG
jgi:uncharacterized protein (DUF305 family)